MNSEAVALNVCGNPMHGNFPVSLCVDCKRILQAIDEAVRVEREECARVAEGNIVLAIHDEDIICQPTRNRIAEAIRKRGV